MWEMCEQNQKSLEGVNDFRRKSVKIRTWKHAIQNTPGKQQKQKKSNFESIGQIHKITKSKISAKKLSKHQAWPGLGQGGPQAGPRSKIEKVGKMDVKIFALAPVGEMDKPFSPTGPLPTGGHSVEAPPGRAPAALKCFFTFFFPPVFWSLFCSCHSLLALVNPF